MLVGSLTHHVQWAGIGDQARQDMIYMQCRVGRYMLRPTVCLPSMPKSQLVHEASLVLLDSSKGCYAYSDT